MLKMIDAMLSEYKRYMDEAEKAILEQGPGVYLRWLDMASVQLDAIERVSNLSKAMQVCDKCKALYPVGWVHKCGPESVASYPPGVQQDEVS